MELIDDVCDVKFVIVIVGGFFWNVIGNGLGSCCDGFVLVVWWVRNKVGGVGLNFILFVFVLI